MAEILAPCFSLIIITTPGSFKKSDPRAIFDAFTRAAGGNGGEKPEVLLIEATGEAIRKSRELSRERELPALGAGSFYLAGEIRTAFGGAAGY
jgi:dihydrofolate synthase/folylpolyglutamate synthase